jgi:flagellar export protein FliJ
MSLKSLIEFRRHREELAREELEIVARELAAHLDRITGMEIELQRILGEMVRQNEEGISAADALAFHRFADVLVAKLATARRIAEDLKHRMDERRGILLEAARDCRIVEKLETRRDQRRLQTEERREQQRNDELSLRRWQNSARGVDLG